MPQNQQNPYGFDYDPDWRNRDATEETERGFVDPQVVPPTTRPAEDFTGTYGFEYQPNWREEELTAPDEYGWGFVNAWRRGMERLSAMPDVAQGDYEELAQHFGNLEQYRMSDEDMAKFEELRNTEGFWAKLGGVLANPRLVGQVVAESLPMMAAPIVGATGGGLAGGAVGGPIGAGAGMMAGGGLGSYMTEYYASIGDFFGQQGIDMSNPAELKAAFDNEQLMQQAREHARARGIPIAIFDALSMGLAGRIAKPVSGVVGKVTGGRRIGAGTVGEIGMQAGLGAAGEAGAQLASEGEITDELDVILEGVAEIVPGFAEAGVSRLTRKKAGIPDPNDSPLAALDQAEPSDSSAIPETDIDMRTGKVITRTGDEEYDALDKALEQASVDLEMTLETDRLAKQVAREGAERAAEIQGSRNMQMIEMEQERDAQLQKQGRLEEARKAAQEDQMWQEQVTAGIEDVGAAESEMVTPQGVPVEGEPIDVAGGQPAEEGMLRPEGVVPPGGRPFGVSLGEALREAGYKGPEKPPWTDDEDGGPPPPAPSGAKVKIERGPDVTRTEAIAAETLEAEEEARAEREAIQGEELAPVWTTGTALGEKVQKVTPIKRVDQERNGTRISGVFIEEGKGRTFIEDQYLFETEEEARASHLETDVIPQIKEAITGNKEAIQEAEAAGDAAAVEKHKKLLEQAQQRLTDVQAEIDSLTAEVPFEPVEAAEAAPVEPAKPTTPKPTKRPNYARDNFLTTRAKETVDKRLSMEKFEAEGLDIADMREKVYGGKPAFSRHPNAMGPDDVAEFLNENNYPNPFDNGSTGTWDANQALEAVRDEMAGVSDILTGEAIENRATEARYEEELMEFQRQEEEAAPAGGEQLDMMPEPTGRDAQVTRDQQQREREAAAPEADMGVAGDLFTGTSAESRQAAEMEAAQTDIEEAEAEGFTPAEEALTEEEARDQERADFEARQAQLRDTGETRRKPEEIIAEIEANIPTMKGVYGDTFGDMGRPRLVTAFRQLEKRIGENEDFDAILEKVTDKLTYKPTRDAFIGAINASPETNLLVADIERQHEEWRQEVIETDWMKLDTNEINRNNARIDELAEMGDPRAIELAKEADHWMNKDRIQAKSSHPRFKQSRKSNKYGGITDIRGRDSISLDAAQLSATVDYDSLTFQSPEDQARADRILEVIDKVAGQIEPTPEATPGGTPSQEAENATHVDAEGNVTFTIDEQQFNEVIDEWSHIAETPPKSKRQAIDVKLKNSPFIPLEEAQKKIDEWAAHAAEQRKQPTYRKDVEGYDKDDYGFNPMDNSQRIVISLFDYTGQWARPWAEAGYDVYTFDIKSGQDAMDFSIEWFANEYNFDKEIYAILAAPPCTTFSNSGTRWRKSRHDAKSKETVEEMWGAKAVEQGFEVPNEYGKELVAQTMRVIEYFRPKVWALENPEGRIESQAKLNDWRTGFQPSNFGDPYTKRTLLWGKFNDDMPTANVEPTEGSKMHKMSPSDERAAMRSETPEGFSYAFFMANNYNDKPIEERLPLEFPEIAGAVQEAIRADMTEPQIREAAEFAYFDDRPEEAAEALRAAIEPTPPPPSRPPGIGYQLETEIMSKSVQELAKRDKIDLQAISLRLGIDDTGNKVELARRIKDFVASTPAAREAQLEAKPEPAPEPAAPKRFEISGSVMSATRDGLMPGITRARMDRIAENFAKVGDQLLSNVTTSDRKFIKPDPFTEISFSEYDDYIRINSVNLSGLGTANTTRPDVYDSRRPTHIKKAIVALDQKLQSLVKYQEETPTALDIARAEADTNTEATEAQKEAGNYKKGRVPLPLDMEFHIETPEGEVRYGKQKLRDPYGGFTGTKGMDGDPVDGFLNKKIEDDWRGDVYIVDQVNPETKKFDEHKVMFGYNNAMDARRAYKRNYQKDWTGTGNVTIMPIETFKQWLDTPGATKKPAAEFGTTEAAKKAREKSNKDNLYASGKDMLNAPSIEFVKKVLEGGEKKMGDVVDTMPLQMAVDELLKIREQPVKPVNEFKSWFGNSKVVDKAGKPLVVFHGTADYFTNFELEARGKATGAPSAKEAFFFTDRKKTADYYARMAPRARPPSQRKGLRPQVKQVYLSMQNPLIHDYKGQVYRGADTSYKQIIDQAKAAGHDGVILLNTYDAGEYGKFDAVMSGRFKGETIYGVFDPSQIKTVTQAEQMQPAGFQAPEAPAYMPDSEEIEAAIKPLEDRMPGAPVRLLFDYRQAPEIVQRGMEADNMTHVPAVYSPVTNEIYLFTTRIDSTEHAVQLALHEKTHQGLREAFGPELDTILEDVYENASPQDVAYMMDLSGRYNKNMNILEDQLVLAEELIAYKAETDPQNNIVQRVVAFIKKWLRKAGLRLEYSDADITAIIAEAQNAIARRDSYDSVMLTEDVEVAETGEIYEVETPAKDAVDAVDKRIEMCKKVKNCL